MKKLIIISFLFTSLFLKAQNQDVRQSARKLEEVLTYINIACTVDGQSAIPAIVFS